MGNFCSWECMKSFNLDHNKTRCGIISGNIVLLHKSMYGHVRSIKCAPNRFSLKEFGGTLTIEEFRSNSNVVIVNMPDELHRPQEVLVRSEIRSEPMSHPTEKFNEITRATSSGESLKLKRPKPLKRDDNNLEKTLGIIRKK
jgi:hypothetical protein